MAKSSSKLQNNPQDIPPKFLDDKFFFRLMTKKKYNSSKQSEASFQVSYYSDWAGSIPFVWESQPGTPKHTFHQNPLPPLTPPPSYQFIHQKHSIEKNNSKNSNFLNFIFSSKKINAMPLSSYSEPSSFNNRKNNKASSRSAVGFELVDEDENQGGTCFPTTLCFGPGNGSSQRGSKCYFNPKSMKKFIVGN